MPPISRFLIVAGLVSGLGACESPGPPPVRIVAYTPVSTYCYVSLANRECYRDPVAGQDYRLAGTRPTEPR